jgi:hypothetical protein
VTPTPTETATQGPTVHPTTVGPTDPGGGIAFTGAPSVLPMGALALALLTTGTGLMWIGHRRRREDDPS